MATKTTFRIATRGTARIERDSQSVVYTEIVEATNRVAA